MERVVQMVTIREAISRLKAEGYGISEYSLRLFVKTGQIPAREVGRKVLLFYPNVISFLQSRDGADNAPSATVMGGIRRVDRG